MTAWPAEQMAAHGGVGILAVMLLLPALEAALRVIGALLPGQTAVVLGGMLARQGHVTVEAALLTALTGAVLANLAGDAVGWRRKGRAQRRPRQPGRIRARMAPEGPGPGTAPGEGGAAPVHGTGSRSHRTPRRRSGVRRPLHRRAAHPGADLVRGVAHAPAALPAVARGQQCRVAPGVRAHRLRHRARRTRVTPPRRQQPTQPPATPATPPATRHPRHRTRLPGPALNGRAAGTRIPSPNPPSRPGVREDRHRTSGDR